jgi:hypothetical protein
MSLWLLLVVLSFATFRVTRLIVFDTFPPIAWSRRKIQHARPFVRHEVDVHEDGIIRFGYVEDYWWLGELIGCIWCASAYVSGGLVLVAWLMWGMPAPILCWLAVWGLGAFLAKVTS